MINVNRVEVVGNLTKDPELRYTPTNQAVASFAVATNRRYKDQTGNWIDSPPEYHDVVVWGQLGERCNQVLHKGDRVFLTGRLQTRSWEAPDGNKRYKTEVVVETIIGPDQVNKNMGNAGDGLGSNSFGGNAGYESGSDSGPAPKAATPKSSGPASDEEINIDDIPF